MRVDIGYDSHPFAKGASSSWAAWKSPHSKGLGGYSDADAVAHAVTARSSAPRVGRHRPHVPQRTTRAGRNASSIALLKQGVLKVVGSRIPVRARRR